MNSFKGNKTMKLTVKYKYLLPLGFSMFAFNALAGTLVFEEAGFSIKALDAPPGTAGAQPLTMLLPASDGFSANVNVQIQPYNGSLAQYKNLSDAQFKQFGFKPLISKVSNGSVIFEYTGSMSGKTLHWYSRGYKKGDFVYLVTATAQAANWQKTKNKLMSVVDSFRPRK